MKKHTLKRYLASLLAVLMLISVTGVSPAVFADDTTPPQQEESATPQLKQSSTPIEVLIKSGMNDDEVRTALANALLENADQVDAQSLEWTYTCKGSGSYRYSSLTTKTATNTATGNIFGFTSDASARNWKSKIVNFTCTHPALKDNNDGEYTLYLNGQSVQIKKVAKLTSSVSVANNTINITIPYNADGSVNSAKLHELIFNAAGVTTVPENLTYDQLSYSGTVAEGAQTITISYNGNDDYYASSVNVTVNFTDSRSVAFTQKDKPATLSIGYVDGDVNVDKTLEKVREQLVNKVGDVELDQVKVEYETSVLGILTDKYKDLSEISDTEITYYRGISTNIRLSYAGDATHKAFNATVEGIKFADNRVDAPFTVAVPEEGVSLVFNDDTTLNYEGIENAIRALVTSSDESISTDVIDVKYKVTSLNYQSLNYDPIVSSNKFGEGTFTIKLSWKGNSDYKAFEWTGDITFKDNRIQSVIALVDGASITFNMVGDEMLQAIYSSAFSTEEGACTLPEGLTYSDFTYEYKKITTSTNILTGKEETKEEWVSIVGDDGYPNMGADEENAQEIRVSYKGNAEYKGCSATGSITVNKADVKVSVKLLSFMVAGQATLPDDFVTLDPNDSKIDVYTFFVGINTKLQSTVYLKLPESKTQLIDALSDAQVKYLGKEESETLRGKLQEGITVGELREALNDIVNNELLNNSITQRAFDSAMKDYGITYAQLKSIYESLNNISSIADNLKLSIGTPNHAGIYQAFAITANDNYNTAYGSGTVIVLMNWKNIKLQKNDIIDANDSVITVSQAQQLKEDGNLCILTQDGEELTGDYTGAVHYWFTGLNTIYAKSEMPTTPGKYIVTATVLGGDYFALPKTFTFTIVDDSVETTPEVDTNTDAEA
jgi:hypothetical protein